MAVSPLLPQNFFTRPSAFSNWILALLTEARCKQMEKTMIVKWKIKESETIPILQSVGESRKQKGNISLKTIPVNSSAARGKHP